MITARAWLRTAMLAVALALPLATTGCGRHHHHQPEGTLEVVNDDFSTDVLETIEIDDVFDGFVGAFDVFLFPGEVAFFDLYPSTYDLTVYWGDSTVEFRTVDVFDDFTTTTFFTN